MREIVELVEAGTITPGRRARRSASTTIPAEIEAMANRETIGRTIVMLDA